LLVEITANSKSIVKRVRFMVRDYS
jgi:hypothetical protein